MQNKESINLEKMLSIFPQRVLMRYRCNGCKNFDLKHNTETGLLCPSCKRDGVIDKILDIDG